MGKSINKPLRLMKIYQWTYSIGKELSVYRYLF
jgi:hypothetical protein